jgi:hypothetical protein
MTSPFQATASDPTDGSVAPSYDITCGSFYYYSGSGAESFTFTSFTDCIDSCPGIDGCVGVLWVEPSLTTQYYGTDGTVGLCRYVNGYDATLSYPGVQRDMAVLPGDHPLIQAS